MRPTRFQRKHRVGNTIPTISMGDIAFLLLIFFMATTIFRLEQGLQIVLPSAETAEKPRREHVARIWIDRTGRISIDDRLVTTADVEGIIKTVLMEAPEAVIALNADEKAPYGVVADVIEELKDANAARLSFTSDREERTVPPSRAP
ncbi:MAG TPA: biopolymer transporter ExbD [Candidatus Krumholzibacteria bacterium]|nr:biopolymer transporter ExbD [Candidatus Krumholzibacteria bacterium]